MNDTDQTTIEDFGAQWSRYTDNEGYYGSVELLADLIQPLLGLEQIKGAKVADIGSGTGRIVTMLLEAGAAEVTAVEPSEAVHALRANTKSSGDRVRIVHGDGLQTPLDSYDLVLSMGVLHHIVDVDPVMSRAYQALKPGGTMLAWLYGREGNGAYLSLIQPLRAVTRRLPDAVLAGLSHALTLMLDLYIALCRVFPLPLREYTLKHLALLSRRKRYLTVFDQLNPAYAKYYTRAEAEDLFRRAGFTDIRLHHRHGYSWTVVGTRPPR